MNILISSKFFFNFPFPLLFLFKSILYIIIFIFISDSFEYIRKFKVLSVFPLSLYPYLTLPSFDIPVYQ